MTSDLRDRWDQWNDFVYETQTKNMPWPTDDRTVVEIVADERVNCALAITGAREQANECIEMWTACAGRARRGGMYDEAEHYKAIALEDERELVDKVNEIQCRYARRIAYVEKHGKAVPIGRKI